MYYTGNIDAAIPMYAFWWWSLRVLKIRSRKREGTPGDSLSGKRGVVVEEEEEEEEEEEVEKLWVMRNYVPPPAATDKLCFF